MKVDLYLLDRHFKYTKFVSTPMMGVLKVWTESMGYEARVTVCDEQGVDINTDADVVAFSVYTFMAPAAYRLGDKLRQKGKVVILGGPHFHGSQTIEEAKPHCNAVVQTISEEQWRGLLQDIDDGKLHPESPEAIHIIDKESKFQFPENMHESYGSVGRNRFPLVMTTLGCPYRCEFCNPFMPGKYILRDIDAIYRELSHTRTKHAVFCDATFGINKKHSIELMKAIAPLNKFLFIQTTLGLLDDKALLDALSLGGVVWVCLGIETFSLPQKKHGRNRVDKNLDTINRIIDSLNERGIHILGNFICGMDCDNIDSFERIYEFYQNSNIDCIIVDIMAPYPNTALFNRLEQEGRIFDYNWEHYDFHHLVFKPLNMTEYQLIDGYIQLYRSLTSFSLTLRKNLHAIKISGINRSWPLMAFNLAHNFDARKKEKSFRQDQERGYYLNAN